MFQELFRPRATGSCQGPQGQRCEENAESNGSWSGPFRRQAQVGCNVNVSQSLERVARPLSVRGTNGQRCESDIAKRTNRSSLNTGSYVGSKVVVGCTIWEKFCTMTPFYYLMSSLVNLGAALTYCDVCSYTGLRIFTPRF